MRQSLNYGWSYVDHYEEPFLESFPKDVKIVDIPHNTENVPYNYFSEKIYQKKTSYEKIFDVDNFNQKERTYVLHFCGFMLQADIYLNNENLGHFVSGYIPVDIDVSKFLKEKNNRLVVILDSKEDNDIPPFGYAVDYLTFGGIYREVYLENHTKTYLKDIFVQANNDGEIKISYTKVGNDEINISHILYEKGKDEPLLEFKEGEAKYENPHIWDIEDPFLYQLKTIVTCGNEKDEITTTFGFREIIWNEYGFFLNDQKVKLLGLNRHQLYPYVGAAMPKSMQADDADRLKSIGCNIVRTSHYPQSEHFLDRCDEIGLLVVNEIPGWQHISKDVLWRNQYYKNVESMVLTQRNHPSLIAHGVRIDESNDDHDLYKRGNQIAHDLDPSRPTLGVRNFKGSELLEDIYAYNDFSGWSKVHGLEEPIRKKICPEHKPYIVTEYMGHVHPDKPTADADRLRHVALCHARIINDMMMYDSISGCVGWCFVDYYTHVDFGSGDHICPHGVMDMYRNPKYVAYVYQAQQDDKPVLELLTNMRPGDNPGANFDDIYVMTNADHVDLYRNGGFVSSFYPTDKEFKYMKHPPIHITDIIGETFKDSRFSKKERLIMAKILSHVGFYGFNNWPMKMKLQVASLVNKYHMSWADLTKIWNDEVATWGGLAKTFTFKAIDKEGHVVLERTIAPCLNFHYEYEVDKTTLINEDTYDASSVHIHFMDEYHNIMRYSNEPVLLSVEGPIELMGPNAQVTLGGSTTIYIRSKHEEGKAKLTIKTRLDEKVIEFNVKNATRD